MPAILFKCKSCGKQIHVADGATETKSPCLDCGSKQDVPQSSILQTCPNCNQVVKIDPALKGEILHCRGCKKSILLPVRRGDQIYCLCKRCEKTIEIPVANAGKLLACPQCAGWICGPELTAVIDESPSRTPIHHPITFPTAAATVLPTKPDLPSSAPSVLQNLEDQARRLVNSQCFFLAAFLLKYYDGEYKEETKAARLKLAQSYLDAANKYYTANDGHQGSSGAAMQPDVRPQ